MWDDPGDGPNGEHLTKALIYDSSNEMKVLQSKRPEPDRCPLSVSPPRCLLLRGPATLGNVPRAPAQPNLVKTVLQPEGVFA